MSARRSSAKETAQQGFYLAASSALSVGKVRKNQEDAVLVDHRQSVYAVADGMGGTDNGEVASQTAVMALQLAFIDENGKSRGVANMLRCGFRSANELIFAASQGLVEVSWMAKGKGKGKKINPGPMGTTMCALACDHAAGKMLIANVGDSRCYLWRDQALHQLTEDHRGMRADRITRAVGVLPTVETDVFRTDALLRDLYILCSDGIHGPVSDEQIADIIRSTRGKNLNGVAKALVDAANKNGGPDNSSVVLVNLQPPGGA